MTRWIGKRGLWGVVATTAVAAGSGILAGAEPGETVVFKEGNKDRKVTIVKANKRPDGSVEVHGKDAVTGDAVVWVEGGKDAAPPAPPTAGKTAPAAAPAKDAGLPKAKARPDDPMGSAATPMPETPAERDRRLFNGKLLGRDAPAPATAPAPPQIAEAGEPKQKTGLLNRLFGKKSTPAPVPTAMPAAATPPGPAFIPAPAPSGEPKVVTPARPTVTSAPKAAPVAIPTPAVSVPMPLPATRPSAPAAVPVPAPLPATPVPLPAIPVIPGGAQSARPGEPIQVILPVGYVPAEVALAEDIRPYAATLKNSVAPSQRAIAAKGLAEGRHGSSDQVKALLFSAAKFDPAPTVRAACIDHLCRLGFYHPQFLTHLQTLAAGPAGEEQDAAKVAIARMTPRQW